VSLGTLVLVLRLALAAVFALAAATKLGRRTQTEAALESFGVPTSFRPTVAVILPLAELAVAVALLPAASSPYAAVAATLMLAAFTFAVAGALRRGDRIDCNCFGSLGSDEVSRSTLARDLALLVPAGFLAVVAWGEPGPGALAWIGDLDGLAAVAILGGVALAVAVLGIGLCVELMRQNGRLLERLEALEGAAGRAPAGASGAAPPRHTGRPVPAFALPDLDGHEVGLDGLLAEGRELLLVFSDPGCHACNPVLPEVGRLQRASGGPLPVVMSLGDAEINRVKASEHGLELVLLQEDFDLARSLGVSGMPGAVLVDRAGRIAAEPAENSDKVRELLASLTPPSPAARLEVTVGGRR
jgi:Methylamine utilisation protein MauE